MHMANRDSEKMPSIRNLQENANENRRLSHTPVEMVIIGEVKGWRMGQVGKQREPYSHYGKSDLPYEPVAL